MDAYEHLKSAAQLKEEGNAAFRGGTLERDSPASVLFPRGKG